MSYKKAIENILSQNGVEESTMMKTHCIRYKGKFIGMNFEKAGGLIIKVPKDRAQELINDGLALEFTFTKKKFNEWVVIPSKYEVDYFDFLQEALEYAESQS